MRSSTLTWLNLGGWARILKQYRPFMRTGEFLAPERDCPWENHLEFECLRLWSDRVTLDSSSSAVEFLRRKWRRRSGLHLRILGFPAFLPAFSSPMLPLLTQMYASSLSLSQNGTFRSSIGAGQFKFSVWSRKFNRGEVSRFQLLVLVIVNSKKVHGNLESMPGSSFLAFFIMSAWYQYLGIFWLPL